MGQKPVPVAEEVVVYENVPLSAEDLKNAEVNDSVDRKVLINLFLAMPTSDSIDRRCILRPRKHINNLKIVFVMI